MLLYLDLDRVGEGRMGKEKVIMRNGWEGMGENEESIHRSGEERRGRERSGSVSPTFYCTVQTLSRTPRGVASRQVHGGVKWRAAEIYNCRYCVNE